MCQLRMWQSLRRFKGTWIEWKDGIGKDGTPVADRYGWIKPFDKIGWAVQHVHMNDSGATHETHP